MTTFIRQKYQRERERERERQTDRQTDRQDRYVPYIKHKKSCSTNDKYHTYTGMVQKGYCDNVIDLFMYIFKKNCE